MLREDTKMHALIILSSNAKYDLNELEMIAPKPSAFIGTLLAKIM